MEVQPGFLAPRPGRGVVVRPRDVAGGCGPMDSLGSPPLPAGPSPLVAVMAWTQRHWRICRWCFLVAGCVIGATTDHLLFDATVRAAAACWGAM